MKTYATVSAPTGQPALDVAAAFRESPFVSRAVFVVFVPVTVVLLVLTALGANGTFAKAT